MFSFIFLSEIVCFIVCLCIQIFVYFSDFFLFYYSHKSCVDIRHGTSDLLPLRHHVPARHAEPNFKRLLMTSQAATRYMWLKLLYQLSLLSDWPYTECQGTTCYPLQRHLGVLPTPTSDTFGILQTLTASEFQRHFGVLFWPPSSSPQHSCMLLPLWPLNQHPFRWPLQNLCLLKGNPETSSESALSDPKSALMFYGNSPSHSGDRAAPMASDIKGRVIKVIRNVKGRWWSGSMGNAGRWPWS